MQGTMEISSLRVVTKTYPSKSPVEQELALKLARFRCGVHGGSHHLSGLVSPYTQ